MGHCFLVLLFYLPQSVPRSVGSQIIGDEVLASCSRGTRGNEQLRISHQSDKYFL